MGFTDLHDYLAVARRRGMLRRINGGDWNLEIGAIATMLQGSRGDQFEPLARPGRQLTEQVMARWGELGLPS